MSNTEQLKHLHTTCRHLFKFFPSCSPNFRSNGWNFPFNHKVSIFLDKISGIRFFQDITAWSQSFRIFPSSSSGKPWINHTTNWGTWDQLLKLFNNYRTHISGDLSVEFLPEGNVFQSWVFEILASIINSWYLLIRVFNLSITYKNLT